MLQLPDALSSLPDAVFADVLERDDAYLFVLDLPGVGAEDVDVSVVGHRLHVEAYRTKAVPDEFEYRSEDRSVFLDADLPLPPDIVGTDADATMKGGVLEVRLPKRPTTPTSIPVSGE